MRVTSIAHQPGRFPLVRQHPSVLKSHLMPLCQDYSHISFFFPSVSGKNIAISFCLNFSHKKIIECKQATYRNGNRNSFQEIYKVLLTYKVECTMDSVKNISIFQNAVSSSDLFLQNHSLVPSQLVFPWHSTLPNYLLHTLKVPLQLRIRMCGSPCFHIH